MTVRKLFHSKKQTNAFFYNNTGIEINLATMPENINLNYRLQEVCSQGRGEA